MASVSSLFGGRQGRPDGGVPDILLSGEFVLLVHFPQLILEKIGSSRLKNNVEHVIWFPSFVVQFPEKSNLTLIYLLTFKTRISTT